MVLRGAVWVRGLRELTTSRHGDGYHQARGNRDVGHTVMEAIRRCTSNQAPTCGEITTCSANRVRREGCSEKSREDARTAIV